MTLFHALFFLCLNLPSEGWPTLSAELIYSLKTKKNMKEVLLNDGHLADIARLRSRWVMMEAADIMEATDCPRSFALVSAWRAWRLLDALSVGRVAFCYEKEDGDTRMAIGTLCRGVDKGFDAYLELHDGEVRKPKRETPCCFAYWDIEKEGFRTFKSYKLYQLMEDMTVMRLKGAELDLDDGDSDGFDDDEQ